jgi:uncharacterized protein with HEPN domain
MTKDVRVYLAHILECVDKIERFTAEGRDRFRRDPMVQDAVIRNLEIMGVAAKRADDAYRANHPGVPWRELASLPDVLIHQYAGVDVERVWAVVEHDRRTSGGHRTAGPSHGGVGPRTRERDGTRSDSDQGQGPV